MGEEVLNLLLVHIIVLFYKGDVKGVESIRYLHCCETSHSCAAKSAHSIFI